MNALMTDVQLRNTIIAIVLGAIVSILTKIAEFYIGHPGPAPTDYVGGIVSASAYLKLAAKSLS